MALRHFGMFCAHFGSGRTGPCSISGHSTFSCPSRPTLRDIWAGFGFWASNLRASNLRHFQTIRGTG